MISLSITSTDKHQLLGASIATKYKHDPLSCQFSCFICRKTCIQGAKKDIVAKYILTLLPVATVKAAAQDKMCDFYQQNKDLDHIAHDLSCHHTCYKSYTHGYSCNFRKASPALVATPLSAGEIKYIRRVITQPLKHVFKDKKAVFMIVLCSVYDLGINDS